VPPEPVEGEPVEGEPVEGEPVSWFFYIVECSDTSFYCGITKDLERRIEEHNRGQGGKYTRSRLPVLLRYTEEFCKRGKAQRREMQIKGWTHKKKVALIEKNSEKLRRLSHGK
jgi:putative endonuclease